MKKISIFVIALAEILMIIWFSYIDTKIQNQYLCLSFGVIFFIVPFFVSRIILAEREFDNNNQRLLSGFITGAMCIFLPLMAYFIRSFYGYYWGGVREQIWTIKGLPIPNYYSELAFGVFYNIFLFINALLLSGTSGFFSMILISRKKAKLLE